MGQWLDHAPIIVLPLPAWHRALAVHGHRSGRVSLPECSVGRFVRGTCFANARPSLGLGLKDRRCLVDVLAVQDDMSPPAPRPHGAERRRLAVALVGGALAIGAAGWSSGAVAASGPTSSSLKAAVVSAVKTSTAKTSARVSVSMRLGTGGQGVSVEGHGLVDFDQTATDLTVTLTSFSGGGAERAAVTFRSVLIGGITYVNEPQVANFLPGKTWVSEVLGTRGVTSDVPFNPAYLLKLVEARGTQVGTLGTSTVDRQTVRGYGVTLANRSSVTSSLRRIGLPTADRNDISQFLQNGGTHFHLFVNSSNEVVQARLNTMVSTSSGKVGASLTIDFSDYGAPASISGPPSGQVATIQQFAAAEHQS